MIQIADDQATLPMTESSDSIETNRKDLSNELVFLIHGIASPRVILLPLAKRMRSLGYQTRIYGYNSIWFPIRRHTEKFVGALHKISDGYDKIHLIGHSMGGIITRCALNHELPENLGRIVMLAPPNGGSHIATRNAPWHGWFSPPVLEMRDTPDSFVNQLGPLPANREVGVLAASNDFVIAPGKTEVEGQTDHHTVDSWHTGILWRPETATLADHFFRYGSFGIV